MDGLKFITAPPPATAAAVRADIACFVGFVGRRPVSTLTAKEDQDDQRAVALRTRLPEWLCQWWRDRDWLPPEDRCTKEQFERLISLRDVPVLIETWDAFDNLFAWDERPVDAAARRADTLLGAAVRSFFRQGGRKCYVVRVRDPLPVFSTQGERSSLPDHLLPTFPLLSGADRSTWRGVGHLLGLPDVSFLCLPDLPDLFAADTVRTDLPPAPAAEEHFIECATRVDPVGRTPLRDIPAPRCDEDGFARWGNFLATVQPFLERQAREVQFIAALPLPWNDSSAAPESRRRMQRAREALWTVAANVQSASVQLTYPWLRTRDADALPERLEPPDGTLAGLLANSALTRGAWRPVAREPVPGLLAVEPILTQADLGDALPFRPQIPPRPDRTRRERISVFGPTSGGLRLLSDVTTDDDEAWRPANVNRLMNLILRAARQAGEEFAFASSGERLWAQLREALNFVLAQLCADGAFHGATPQEAFTVRCDRSTMTQADLDAGRVIATVQFTAAAPIERIVVVFGLSEGGQVSLLSAQPLPEAA